MWGWRRGLRCPSFLPSYRRGEGTGGLQYGKLGSQTPGFSIQLLGRSVDGEERGLEKGDLGARMPGFCGGGVGSWGPGSWVDIGF